MGFTFGAELKKMRKAKRVTLKELAKKCGISQSYLSDVEQGRRDPFETQLIVTAGLYLGDANGHLTKIGIDEKLKNLKRFKDGYDSVFYQIAASTPVPYKIARSQP